MHQLLASRRTFLAGLAAGTAVAASGAPAVAQTPQKLRIGLIPSDFSGQPYYGKDMGFFAKAGLDVELTGMNNGPAIASAISGGALDVGFSNVPSLALAHARGLPYKLIASAFLYDTSSPTVGLLTVKSTAPLNAAKDFSGKVIAVGAINNITQIGARAWLDANGGDSTAVKWIEVPISTMATELLAGRIDGAILDQGVYPTLGKPGDPLRIVAATFTAIAPRFISGGWFCTQDWLDKNKPLARSFVTAIYQTAQWGNDKTHHAASADILSKYLKESATNINATTRVTYGTSLAPAAVQPVIDVVARYKLIPAAFPASELIGSIA